SRPRAPGTPRCGSAARRSRRRRASPVSSAASRAPRSPSSARWSAHGSRSTRSSHREPSSKPPVHLALHRFVVLYAAMYGAFGVSSPFMPAFFEHRGLAAGQIGTLFAAGTAVRLISGPLVGRVADATQALRTVLAVCALLAAGVAAALLSASSFVPLLLISLLYSAALAPTTSIADALALSAAQPRDGRPGFEYGWVRGTGSGIFVLGTLASGQGVAAWGLSSILVLQAALLVAASAAAAMVPAPDPHGAEATAERAAPSGVMALLGMSQFRRVMLVAALVLGSHAMHDTFAVIRWSAAGITPPVVSVLWSESVA